MLDNRHFIQRNEDNERFVNPFHKDNHDVVYIPPQTTKNKCRRICGYLVGCFFIIVVIVVIVVIILPFVI